MAVSTDLKSLLHRLTLDEKVSLLSGADGWQTQDIPKLGIGSLKTTDGPAGARGALSTDGPTAAFLPAPVAQAATWSKSDLHTIGQLLCRETVTKNAEVLLAPTICCARNPLGGRNFETFSEDPFLTGSLATEYIRGLQESGQVAATAKHFVANEQEYERFTVNAEIHPRALREIYLRPFEMVVKSTNPPKCVMTAYNCVNGTHMDANKEIVQDILRDEWGFQGLVMSDWGGTNFVIESILAGCDLEMPGPTAKRGQFLVEAVKKSSSDQLLAAVDASCLRVLALLQKQNLLDLSEEQVARTRKRIEKSFDIETDRKILREVAANGIVLLKNSIKLLPLTPSKLRGKSVAFIGRNTMHCTAGGGGSATMNPHYQTQPFASFTSMVSELGIDIHINYGSAVFNEKWLPLASSKQWKEMCTSSPNEGQGILKLDYFNSNDFSGLIVETQYRESSWIDLFDSAPARFYEEKKPYSCRISGCVTPQTSGKHSFGVSSVGNARLFVDDELLIDNFNWETPGETFYCFGSAEKRVSINMTAGRPYNVTIEIASRVDLDDDGKAGPPTHVFSIQPSVRIGFQEQLNENAIADAVELSNKSDITIVMIGLNDEWESEGYDRKDMKLPGNQDQLVQTLLGSSVAPENIIIVNQSGSPVEMDWAGDASTIVQAWYGGQEAGNALCDVLLGRVNPSGRLPITWPKKYADLPFQSRPHTWPGVDGLVEYGEGSYVGYRWYERNAVEPQWWFGYGLGYTTFELADVTVTESGTKWEVEVSVRNVGDANGREVVQCYVSASQEAGAVRQLRAFEKTAELQPGTSQRLQMSFTSRELAYWNVELGKWSLEKGVYNIGVGRNAGDDKMVIRQVMINDPETWMP